jgi:hypothetical protein
MSVNQDIRFATEAGDDNPKALYEFVKPSRWIFNNVNPTDDTGENKWFFVNTVTGDLFEKSNGSWFLVYNFATGGGGSDITNIENDGDGEGWFRYIIGSTAHFKSVEGATDEIDVIDLTSKLQIAMNANYVPPLLADLVGSSRVSGDSFSPGPNIDETLGFSVGSVWSQTGGGGLEYVCLDATAGAAVWKFVGPFECENIGTGEASIFAQQTVPPAAPRYQFRHLRNVLGETTITQSADHVTIGINNSYIPEGLDKVPNVFNGYDGSLFPPTVSTDSSLGYQKGSIYTQVTTTPDAGNIWVCADASVGAAVWLNVSNAPANASKDFINWTGAGPSPQVMGFNYVDLSLGLSADIRATQTPTSFSAVYDGARLVFRRAAVSSAQNYEAAINLRVTDFAGATTRAATYDIIMIRKTGLISYSQSIASFVLPVSTISNRVGFVSVSFIINESSLAQEDYYFQIRGRLSGLPDTVAQNFNIDHWGVSFKQI